MILEKHGLLKLPLGSRGLMGKSQTKTNLEIDTANTIVIVP